MFAEDAATFLADYGSPAGWTPALGAPVSGLVVFDQPDEVVEGGDAQSRQYQATFVTASWPGLKRGEVLQIHGDGKGYSYRLRHDPRALADGVFSVVMLTKV